MVVAAGGPKALALAAEVADTVTFVMLALHVAAVGDGVAPFMAGPDTDPEALRAADSVAYLPSDPSAAAEEVQRRRAELGFSYFVLGADVSRSLDPMVARLSGT